MSDSFSRGKEELKRGWFGGPRVAKVGGMGGGEEPEFLSMRGDSRSGASEWFFGPFVGFTFLFILCFCEAGAIFWVTSSDLAERILQKEKQLNKLTFFVST